MASAAQTDRRRYPLHVTLTFAFTAILVLFGGVLIGFNYLENRGIALLSADRQMDRVGTHLKANVRGLYGPVQNVVDVSSRTLPPGIDEAEGVFQIVGMFTEVLRIKPDISAVFVGYDDGSFLLVRSVADAHTTVAAPDPPEGTRFVVQRIDRRGEEAQQHLRFLDDDLKLLERRTVEWTGYDPTERDWYRDAQGVPGQVLTEFYRFFTTHEIGVTVARRLDAGSGVVGADLALSALSEGLRAQRITDGAHLAMLEPDGGVIALSETLPDAEFPPDGDPVNVAMPHVSDLDEPAYQALAGLLPSARVPGELRFELDGRTWLVALDELPVRWGEPIVLANLVPRHELLTGVKRILTRSLLISLGALLIATLLVTGVARHISKSLRTLAREAQKIRELRLDAPLEVHSTIQEVDELAETMSIMKSSLSRFLEISQALSAQKRFESILEMILDEARRVSGADGGTILLGSEDELRLEVALAQGPVGRIPDAAVSMKAGESDVDVRSLTSGAVIRIDDVGSGHAYDLSRVRGRFENDDFTIGSVLSVPLTTQQGEAIGVLQLVFGDSGEQPRILDHAVPYIEALSSSAAVALDNRRLIRAQRELLDSFIHVVAGAIDAKSPYTHGHCQRVPVVARYLAEAAHEAQAGPLAGFRLNDDEWYELHLASWLHDCGKVTTPEYVVDKATKLETIHNRIHEIRTRCEVLWRDAELDYYRALVEGTQDEKRLREQLQARLQKIREEFEFIASCNMGDQFMTDERIERLREVAGRSWTRHLDDRLGLSHLERQRIGEIAGENVEVEETLLADRPSHVIPRPGGANAFTDTPHGFKIEVPENLYDQGELYNLSIRRGTLTAEERFKINEHVIQTLLMLDRLPFPREMRRVPDWAANHHEKLDGTGYPRKLDASELTIPERIMAIADIFEALTSSDRPYMEPRPLAQAVKIMGSMCEEGHLCPELFQLFLDSGVHERYAKEHMRPEQYEDAQAG